MELYGNFIITNNSSKSYDSPDIRLLLPNRVIESPFAVQNSNTSSIMPSFTKKLMSYGSTSHQSGVAYTPSNIFTIKNCPNIPAFSTTKVPITTTTLPFTPCYWIDANFKFHDKESIDVEEHKHLSKIQQNLLEVISFKNTSKVNLPPGSVKLHFVNNDIIENDKIKHDLFQNIYANYHSYFEGCYLDQMGVIPVQQTTAFPFVKDRKAFKYEERTRKLTETFVITITNTMKPSDIIIYDSLNRAKQWALSAVVPEQYEIIDAGTVAWHLVSVPTGSSVEVKYTVTYTWGSQDENTVGQNMQVVEDSSVFEEEAEPTSKTSFLFSKIFHGASKKK